MKIAGIVAEYNPFHKGHAYQINQIREIFGGDTGVVCVMSGDFVQRGEPAVFSKYARAEAAVRCGADLVIELPLHYSVASAERFAQGAVGILGQLGVVDYLVFGSESGETKGLCSAAEALLTSEFDEIVKEKLQTGCSYPVARSAALCALLGENLVQLPNDNLGVEYIKAIKQHRYSMQPIAIRRIGAMHDCAFDGEMKSGSEIRTILRSGADYAGFVPDGAAEIYRRETERGRGPVLLEDMELPILSRLRLLRENDFAQLPDAAEGLEHKLYRACRTKARLAGIYDSVKSKRYTHARIRRMTMCAALGIKKSDYEGDNAYARVLALNERGAAILRKSADCRSLPVISKPAAARELDDERLKMFIKSSDAHDLFVLAYENREAAVGEADWRTSPVFVKG